MRSQVISRNVSVRESPLKSASNSRNVSPNKSARIAQLKPIYFCHYRNAMYMGGSRVNDRHGCGIVLHDNGYSALTMHENNLLHGHSVVLDGQGSILSAEFNRGKCTEAVLRTDSHLLHIRYTNEFAEGDAVLISYDRRKIEYGRFIKGNIVAKRIEKDGVLMQRIFETREISILIPKKHVRALQLKADFGGDIRSDRHGNRITVGFSRNSQLQGLGFKVIEKFQSKDLQQSPGTLATKLLLSERGLYNGSLLDGLGQRRFQNNNVYIGEFVRDLFQGSGLLINSSKKNWVLGRFTAGNLTDLLSYDNDGVAETPQAKHLQEIHKKKSSWRDIDVTLPNLDIFRRQIRKIENFRDDGLQVENIETRKHQVLQRIQYNFMHDGQPDTPSKYNAVLASTRMDSIKAQQMRDGSHPIPPKAKAINNFEATFDQNTHKVRLRPLAITPDLRSQVEQRDQQKNHSTSPTIRVYRPDENTSSNRRNRLHLDFLSSKRQQESTSRSRKKIFGEAVKSPHKNTLDSIEKRPQTRLSSSKRNRIFSPSRSPRTSPINRMKDQLQEDPLRAHQMFATNESFSNKETARLRDEYSPIVSRRSKEDSLESSKRLVGDRLKIFKAGDTEQDQVSFRYRPYHQNDRRGSSSRRNRIF